MARQDFLNAQELVDRLNKEFDKHRNIIEATAESVQKLQGEYKKLPSDYLKIQREIQNTLKAQANAETALIKTKQQSEKLTQDQIRSAKARLALSQQEAKAADQKAKAEARANAELAKAENFHNKVSVRVRELTATYNDLAIKKELGMRLTTKEQAQLLSLEGRLNRYNGAIAKVNERIGKFHNNVGNYASGMSPLNNAIGQFSRELPNLGISVQTFAMSLSNQFGQLQDAINQTVAQNKALIAQGKPVKSVMAEIGASIFSLSTLMYVGIAAATAYIPKFIEWMTAAKSARIEIDLLAKAQERFQDTIVETTTSTERQLTNVNRLVAVMKDETKGMEERIAAAKELQGLYPGYLKNLTLEELTLDANKQQTEAYRKAVKQLTSDIKERVDAESKQSAARENLKIAAEIEQEVQVRKRANEQAKEAISNYGLESVAAKGVLDRIREQIKARKELTDEDQDFISKFGKIGVAKSGSVSGIGLYVESQIVELELQAQALRTEYLNQAQLTNDVIQKTSLLDFKPDDEDAKDMGYESLVDFEASRYELIKTRLENEAEANKRIIEDEENGYADREAAAKRYGEILRELAELRANENIRLLEKETADRKAELDRQVKNEEITLANSNAVKRSLDKQLLYDRQKAYEDLSKDFIDANLEVENSLKGVYENISEQERQNKLTEAQINNMRQLSMLYGNVDGNTTTKQFANLENSIRRVAKLEEDNQVNELRNQRLAIDAEIEKIKQKEKSQVNNEAINKLLGEQLAIDKQLLAIDNKRSEEVAKLRQSMHEATNDYLSQFSTGFLEQSGFGSLSTMFDEVTYQVVNSLGEIETRTGSTFDKLFDQAQTTGQKIGVVFTTMTSVMTQAFEFARQNQAERFQAEYAMAERQRDITLEFYAQGEAGRSEVERQYEEKRREIRIREAKAQKEQALFNAIINTAQAVVAALPNIPLSVIVGALGAAQIAMIASRPIPAYAEGIFGDESHPGGAMLVNDGKHREVIVTPDGKVSRPSGKNVLMNAPKGTQVFPSERVFQKELDGILQQNSIAPFAATLLRDTYGMMSVNSGGLTRDDLESVMSKYTTKSSFVLNVDENGFNAYTQKQNSRTQIIGARITGKGKGF